MEESDYRSHVMSSRDPEPSLRGDASVETHYHSTH